MTLRVLVGLLGVFVAMSACRTYLPYAAAPLADRADALLVIRHTLEQQRGENAPVEVDVSDERFHVVLARVPDSGEPGPVGVGVYYSKIDWMELSEKKGVYAVSIFAVGNALLLHVYAYDREDAERFMDALETMRRRPPERAG